jgi:hypothetical protein
MIIIAVNFLNQSYKFKLILNQLSLFLSPSTVDPAERPAELE